jgi:hypothetical protein
MQKANRIIPASKKTLFIILKPNKGRLVKNKGSKAQCMAQAIEVVMPRASQFIFFILSFMKGKNTKKQQCCKIIIGS